LRHRALADRDIISLSKAEDAAIKIAFLARDLVEQLPHKCDNPQLLSALYWPIRSEVNTLPLINLLLQSGRPVALPIMIKMKYPLVFRLYKENDQLITNKYGLSRTPQR
jgi:5-formyltetrahydrofolate cyclo-ligase